MSGRCIQQVTELSCCCLPSPGNSRRFSWLEVWKNSQLVCTCNNNTSFAFNSLWIEPFGDCDIFCGLFNGPLERYAERDNANLEESDYVDCFALPLYSHDFILRVKRLDEDDTDLFIDLRQMAVYDPKDQSSRTEQDRQQQSQQNSDKQPNASSPDTSIVVEIKLKDGTVLTNVPYMSPMPQRVEAHTSQSQSLYRMRPTAGCNGDGVEAPTGERQLTEKPHIQLEASKELYIDLLCSLQKQLIELSQQLITNNGIERQQLDLMRYIRHRRHHRSDKSKKLYMRSERLYDVKQNAIEDCSIGASYVSEPSEFRHSDMVVYERHEAEAAVGMLKRQVFNTRTQLLLEVVEMQYLEMLYGDLETRVVSMREKAMKIGNGDLTVKTAAIQPDKRLRIQPPDSRQLQASHTGIHSQQLSPTTSILTNPQTITVRRCRMLQDLLRVFPIEHLPGECFTIRGNPLPSVLRLLSSDFREEEGISTSLGFTVHLLVMLSKYLDTPLQYEMFCASSMSAISDGMEFAVSNQSSAVCGGGIERFQYPLSYKSKGFDRQKYNKGILLLAANVEQLAISRGLECHAPAFRRRRGHNSLQRETVTGPAPGTAVSDSRIRNLAVRSSGAITGRPPPPTYYRGDESEGEFVCDDDYCFVMGDTSVIGAPPLLSAVGGNLRDISDSRTNPLSISKALSDFDILDILDRLMYHEMWREDTGIR